MSQAPAHCQEIVKTIQVGASPTTVLSSANGQFVYVANSGESFLSLIDTVHNEAISQKITVGQNPHGLAMTPDGNKLYVTNTMDNTVTVIDTRSNLPLTSIAMLDGQSPAYIAITAEGDKAYVTNVYGTFERFSGNVNVIDLKTDTVVSKISSAARFGVSRVGCAEGIATFPKLAQGERRLAYLNTQCTATGLARNHDPIFVIDADTDLIVGTTDFSRLPNVGSGIAVAPDGKTVWASGADACTAPHPTYDHKGCAPGADNPVTIIDSETYAIKKQLFFGGPQFITFSANGRIVFLATTSSIILIDMAAAIAAQQPKLTAQNFEAAGAIPVAGSTGSVAFTKGGDYAYVPIPSQNAVALVKLKDQQR
jgi:YVTN family beta-propeller protein